MKDILIEFEKVMKAKGPEWLSRLDKGLEIAEIKKLAPFLPESAVSYFSWRNGLLADARKMNLGRLWFFMIGYPLSLAESVEVKSVGRIAYPEWEPHFFPIFASGGGEVYLINYSRHSADYGKLFFYTFEHLPFHGPLISIYSSLEKFFETIIACYKKGAYSFDDQNTFKANYSEEAEISKSLNPDCLFWDL